jgi:hypothetical protein
MLNPLRIVVSLALTAGTLVGAVAVAPSAFAMCDYDATFYSTPYVGRKVWIPTSTFSDWKKGGSITRSTSDGESTATTTGSVHNVDIQGKAGTKIGPVGVEVTAKYNYTHTKTTTTKSSVTRGWAYSFKVPTDALYRARAYKLGWLYKYKKTVTYLGGCADTVKWYYAAAPVRANAGTYYWALEKYDNKGKFRFDNL